MIQGKSAIDTYLCNEVDGFAHFLILIYFIIQSLNMWLAQSHGHYPNSKSQK